MTKEKAHSGLFRSLSQELLANGCGLRFKAIGGSMEPTIHNGDLLHVEPAATEQLRKKDIVFFSDGTSFRAHRVVSVDSGSGMFITRGDAMRQNDPLLHTEQILGRVVAKEETLNGEPRVVRLCGPHAKAHYLALRSRKLISSCLRNSTVHKSAKMLFQKRIFAVSGLFLLLVLLSGSQALGQIAVGNTSNAVLTATNAAHTLNFTLTSAGTNRLLVVGVSLNTAQSTTTTVSGVTYNGVALTQAIARNDAGNTRRAEIWYLLAPPTGTGLTVSVNVSAPAGTSQVGVVAGAITFTGVDQSAPIRSTASNSGATQPASTLTIASTTGDWVLDTLAVQGNRTVTVPGTQTSRWTNTSGNNANPGCRGGGSTKAGATSVTMTENFSNTSNWSQVAVSIKPYPGGDFTGATPAVYFSKTTATGTNRLLVVGVSMNIAGNTGANVTGITYNGDAMTRAGYHNDAGLTRRVEIWYLVNPDVGTDLPGIVTLSLPGGTGTVGVLVGSIGLTGIDPASPVRTGSFVSADGAAGSLSSLNVLSAFGDTVVDTLAIQGDVTATVGPSQILQWAGVSASATANPDVYGLGSTRSGAPSVPMTETFSAASNWSQAALAFRPYSADLSVTNTATSAVFPATISYLIQVTNNGPSTANAVTLTDTVASGLTGVTAGPSSGSCTVTLPTINCNLGNILNGAAATVTVAGTPLDTGGYPNTATVPTNLTPPDYNGNNNSSMAVAFSQMSTCSSIVPPANPTPLTGIINTYFPPSNVNTTVAAGSNSVSLGTSAGANVGISAGDELMFIQMQDAAIDTTNGSTYGDGVSGAGSTNLNNSGVYEFVTATNDIPTSGGTLSFTGSGPGGGLLYTYTNAAPTATQGQRRFQVIRVPRYSSATLGSGLTAAAWNGTTGGVFSLDVAGTLTLGSGTVNVDGLGFRGGAGLQLNGDAVATNSDYRYNSPTTYTGTAIAGAQGEKAEGIAGTPLWVTSGTTYANTASGYPSGIAGTDGSMSRGAPGNAGGGGTDGHPTSNDQNAGGGGGANGGAGGAGGNAWNANLSVGGYGGAPFPASTVRVVMGGGGGAGTRNNTPGVDAASSGAPGGGIVIIRAGSLVGLATISANGASAYNATSNDAGGAGGAGGSVIVLSQSGGVSGLTITANGGRGGDAWDDDTSASSQWIADRHGPGGGGGGGVVLVSGSAASITVNGGANGTTTPGLYPYGATSGSTGLVSTTASLSSTPGNQSSTCFPDMTIVKSHGADFVRGATGIYTLTISNVSVGPIPYSESSGQVTVTDTVPTGVTLSGASGIGWTCNVLPPALTCARSDTLAPAASYPPLLVSVAVPTSAPASVTNSATVSGGGELNTANDTWSDLTNIINATSVVIAKSSPALVISEHNFDYTITVTNKASSSQSGISVTDPLPNGVTFVTASTSQGSCAYTSASKTVNCTIGTIAVNVTVTITITVTAGDRAQVANTATLNPSGATATVTTLIGSNPTAVNLESFTATPAYDGTLLTWKTGEEVHNLGFHIYREQNGQRTRITPTLIAGSALTMRGSDPQHSARTYAWIDHSSNPQGAIYWLEDVDLDGTRTINGPASFEERSEAAAQPMTIQPRALSAARSMTVAEFNAAIATQSDVTMDDSSVSHPVRPAVTLTGSLSNRQTAQFALAGTRAVKIFVDHEGWYRITQPELVAAGLNPYADSRLLQLFVEGVQQPILIKGAEGLFGNFGPQAAIEFYATGLDTPFSDERVYWLVAGQTPGKRIKQQLTLGFNREGPQSFPRTIELKQRTTYFAALLQDRPDNFFGALVSSAPVDQTLNVTNLSKSSGEDAQLQVVLQGVTNDTAHSVQVSLNGSVLGSMDFTDQNENSANFSMPCALLKEGANTVNLTAQNGETDYSVVDYIRLTYPHSYTAESNALKFTAGAGEYVVVHGFQQPPARLFDITNPAEPLQLVSLAHKEKEEFTLTLRVPAYAGERTLLSVSEEQMQKPARLEANVPSTWHSAQRGSDVVLITSGQFTAQVAPLSDLRRSQGHTVAVVNVDDLYDEFNFGERSPNAIRDFLKTATTAWRTRPAYALLVGDASVDPRNYLGFGDFDFVPTKTIITSELKTVSDDWFSDFADNGTAQIATGRLPVRSQDEAQLVVSKIVGYETSPQSESWNGQVMLVADRDDNSVNFTGQAQAIGSLLPGTVSISNIFVGNTSTSSARQQIIDGINTGKVLVNYNGHGSVEVWANSSLFDDTAAASLSNGRKLPVFLMLNCLNGLFHDVYSQSLAESLLLSKNGGAVAVWASSGLTLPEPQFQMDQAIVRSLFSQPSITLGDAIKNAKAGIADSDARRTFILFGDPLLRLKQATTGTNNVIAPR